jgi:hypothetical protein
MTNVHRLAIVLCAWVLWRHVSYDTDPWKMLGSLVGSDDCESQRREFYAGLSMTPPSVGVSVSL